MVGLPYMAAKCDNSSALVGVNSAFDFAATEYAEPEVRQ
jgi:hypothetical protein